MISKENRNNNLSLIVWIDMHRFFEKFFHPKSLSVHTKKSWKESKFNENLIKNDKVQLFDINSIKRNIIELEEQLYCQKDEKKLNLLIIYCPYINQTIFIHPDSD